MKRIYALTASGCAILTSLCPAPVFAQAEPGAVSVEGNEAESEPLSDAEALALDAKAYGANHGVSQEEATRRIVLMARTNENLASSIGIEEAAVAGVYFTHGKDFGLEVRTTAETAPADRQVVQRGQRGRLNAAANLGAKAKANGLTKNLVDLAVQIANEPQTLRVKYAAKGKASRKDVRQTIQTQYAALKAVFSTLDGVGFDEARGVVVAQVLQADANKPVPQNIAAKFAVPIETKTVASPITDIAARGGTRIVWGTTSDLSCTVAFIGKNPSGTLGILTAGHCIDSSWTSGYDYIDGTTRHALLVDYGSLVDNTKEDWVFLNLPTKLSAVGEFYGNKNEAARKLTGRRTQSSTDARVTDGVAQGSTVCFYGMRTGVLYGQSCGEVTYKNINYGGGQGYFVQVEGPSITFNFGDSGSPVFAWSTAFGIVSGCGNPSNTQNTGQRITYTSTDAVYARGYSLAY